MLRKKRCKTLSKVGKILLPSMKRERRSVEVVEVQVEVEVVEGAVVEDSEDLTSMNGVIIS